MPKASGWKFNAIAGVSKLKEAGKLVFHYLKKKSNVHVFCLLTKKTGMTRN
jgi:hypothetical protein